MAQKYRKNWQLVNGAFLELNDAEPLPRQGQNIGNPKALNWFRAVRCGM